MDLSERPRGRRQFDFGMRFRERNAFVAGPKYYGNLDELASKGEVATCYNRSHWAWQDRAEELQWNASFSIMAEVCQDNNPGPVSFSTAYQSECFPFSQGLLTPGSKEHKMLVLISSKFLKKKVLLSPNLRESRLTLENGGCQKNCDSEIFEKADFSTFNSAAPKDAFAFLHVPVLPV